MVQLGDVIELNPRESMIKGTVARKIAMDDLKEFCRDISSFSYTEYKGGTKFRNYDVLLARITPCLENGKTALVDILERNEIAFGSTEFFVLRPKRDLIDPYYLYYLATTDNFRNTVIKSMTGTSGRQRADKNAVLSFEFELPALNKQREIVRPMKLADDKIRLNNQINANLDELMSEIFERYVTEANVFTTDSLSNIANYKNGLAMQRFRPNGADKGLPVLKIKELNQGFTDSSSDRCSSKISNDVIVKAGDIIFSWSGTLIVKIWTGTTCGLNQHLFKVTSDKYPKWFIYKWTEYYLRQFQSIAAGKATTMGHIKRSDLKQAEVKIPHKSEIDRLDKLISPIFKRYVNNILEINSLKELKNELLSKIF